MHQTFEDLIGRAQLPAAFMQKLDRFQYTRWTLFGVHLALHETPRFTAEAFDPNIHRTLKWNLGAETMEDLLSAFQDVEAGRVPRIVQFGSGALSVLDPSQAPPGKHTTYAWHVMPHQSRHRRARSYERFKAEFADAIIEKWSTLLPEHDQGKNIIAQYVYTAHEYMRRCRTCAHGDIFMGAIDAEQVMYNHFGYRTPVPNSTWRAVPAIRTARSPAARAISPPASSRAISG